MEDCFPSAKNGVKVDLTQQLFNRSAIFESKRIYVYSRNHKKSDTVKGHLSLYIWILQVREDKLVRSEEPQYSDIITICM